MPYPQRRHLRRLDRLYLDRELYFVTLTVDNRLACLADPRRAPLLVDAWRNPHRLYGWLIGRYVIMPDHVHYFAAPAAENAATLSHFTGRWKSWTRRQVRQTVPPFNWQGELFDRLLRSEELYEQKWEYVRHNPVRKGLVARPEDWPYQGEIAVLAR